MKLVRLTVKVALTLLLLANTVQIATLTNRVNVLVHGFDVMAKICHELTQRTLMEEVDKRAIAKVKSRARGIEFDDSF